MLSVLAQSLVLASGGILSVGSITIVILLLISDRGWRNGLGYALGYVGAYTMIGISVVVVSYQYTVTGSNAVESGGMSAFLFILMAILLFWVTQRNWRKPPSDEKKTPRFFAILDKITPMKAFLFGAVVTVLNFKNLAIFLSAVSVVLLNELSFVSRIIIVLMDVLFFCTSVIVPVGIYVAFPQTARERLMWIRQTLERYSRPISIWVPLIFGIIFLIQGITGLS